MAASFKTFPLIWSWCFVFLKLVVRQIFTELLNQIFEKYKYHLKSCTEAHTKAHTSTHTACVWRCTKESVYEVSFIPSVYAKVCDWRLCLECFFPGMPLLPSTLHPPSWSHTCTPTRMHTLTHTHPHSSSQYLGPRVNGCSTFPLSRSAKNYLLNDVCINIIYMVISLLLITAGPSAARGVGWSCVKLICQGKIWW